MTIAVDARELEGHPTGVGRVLEGLLEAWPEGDQLDLICRSRPRLATLRKNWRVTLRPGPVGMPGWIWEQTILPQVARGATALLCPGYGMPRFAPCPTAVGMHDCAPFELPETFAWRERRRRQVVARVAARRAAFLLMGSHFAAQQAQLHLGVPPDRLLVLPYGLTSTFTPPTQQQIQAIRARYGLRGRVVLFVGSNLQRRRLPQLIERIARLARTRDDLSLCVVGDSPERAGSEAGPTERSALRRLGYVPDEHLAALYGAATVVAYPSRYEGFGFPVLEALACGSPVVASATSSLAEIYPGRAWLVQDDDPEQWETALAALLDDPSEHARWCERAQDWARARTWHQGAQMVRECLALAGGLTS